MPASTPGRPRLWAVPLPIRLLLLAEAVLAALHVIDAALGHPSWKLNRLVDLGAEANLPTWFSSSLLLVLALLLAALALAGEVKRRWPFLVLSALALMMSLDEVAQIHEWLGEKSDVLLPGGTRKGTLFPHTGIWMFFVAPPLLAVAVLLWRALAPELRRREGVARLFVTGFLVYVASSMGVEVVQNFVTPHTWRSTVQVVCEETGEMLGVTLVLWGTLELLALHGMFDLATRSGGPAGLDTAKSRVEAFGASGIDVATPEPGSGPAREPAEPSEGQSPAALAQPGDPRGRE